MIEQFPKIPSSEEQAATMCIPSVPATDQTLAKYAAYLARQLKASSVRQCSDRPDYSKYERRFAI